MNFKIQCLFMLPQDIIFKVLDYLRIKEFGSFDNSLTCRLLRDDWIDLKKTYFNLCRKEYVGLFVVQRTLKGGHIPDVSTLIQLADGRIASGVANGKIEIWNVASGAWPERTLEGHDSINFIQLADGRIASGDQSGKIMIWNVASGVCERTLDGHCSWVRPLIQLTDGRIASGSGDYTIRIWNVVSGACELTLDGHSDYVCILIQLADGRIASGYGDGTIQIWNVASGACERTLDFQAVRPSIQFNGGPKGSELGALIQLADGRIVSGYSRGKILIWNVANGVCERILEGHNPLIQLTDGRIASGDRSGRIKIWNVASGACEWTWKMQDSLSELSNLIQLADGRIASGSKDDIKIWNVASGRCEQTLNCKNGGHTRGVSVLIQLADGRIASGGGDESIKIWRYYIPQNERDIVKTNLVELMATIPADSQRQFGEDVAIAAEHDFPKNCESLLPQLFSKLNTSDIMVIQGVMLTVYSIMKRYRYATETKGLLLDKYCLHHLALSLLHQYQQTSRRIVQYEGKKPELIVLFETLRLMTLVFFSLNWQDIPDVFKQKMSAWMSEFATYLTYKNPLIDDKYAGKGHPGPIQDLQAAILENLNEYVNKNEFKRFVPQFTELIWKLLLEIDDSATYDHVAAKGIKFLTSVASNQMNIHLFTNQILKSIIEQIIVKNIIVTRHDEDLFENNYADYIRKDMEGSDQDTRHRAAMDLIKTLMKFLPRQISSFCISFINVLFEQYHATENWKTKDAALHILLAVSLQNTNPVTGIADLNPAVNVVEIFETHFMPEIQDDDVNARNILKAHTIKLICALRVHFPKALILSLLPHVIRYLQSDSKVVQTYAVISIEKFMLLKEKDATGQQKPRIEQADILPFFQPLFDGLFNVLEAPDVKQYVMKCIMRSLLLIGEKVTPITELVVHLTKTLNQVCKSPIDLNFNHYLFEAFAIIIKSTCGFEGTSSRSEQQIAACTRFETILFPIFQMILSEDIAEIVPYVFQIFAQLLVAHPEKSGLSDVYIALFPLLLAPVLWERKENVLALVELLKAYISRGMEYIISNNFLEGVLGVFQRLLSAKATEASAFQLMNAIYAFTPLQIISRYLSTIFNLELHRMQESVRIVKVQPFCCSFIHSMCVFCCVYGPQTLIDALESQTSNLSSMIIGNVWATHNAENIAASTTKAEKKDCIIGGTKLLLESSIRTNAQLFRPFFNALLLIVVAATNQKDFTFENDETKDEIRGYSKISSFTSSKLAHSSIFHLDVNAEIVNPRQYFISQVHPFLLSPTASSVIAKAFTPAEERTIAELRQEFNI